MIVRIILKLSRNLEFPRTQLSLWRLKLIPIESECIGRADAQRHQKLIHAPCDAGMPFVNKQQFVFVSSAISQVESDISGKLYLTVCQHVAQIQNNILLA